MPLSFRKQLTAQMRFNSSLHFRAQISTSCSSEPRGCVAEGCWVLGVRLAIDSSSQLPKKPRRHSALQCLHPLLDLGFLFFFFLFNFIFLLWENDVQVADSAAI